MKHILIVEDHAIVRLASRSVLEELVTTVNIYEAADFKEAIYVASEHELDLVLLDIDIPGGEGTQMIGKIRNLQPKVPILMFSGIDETLYPLHYLKAGANGFVSKNASIEDLKRAILSVLAGGRYLSQRVQHQLFKSTFDDGSKPTNPLESLSQRELEVMDLLLEGRWTKEIATALNITGSSVSTYKFRIFEKLEVTTIIELYQKVEFLKSLSGS
ncbi:response regulator [Dyadobacter luticola]|uniref:Response regulator transcription factor n=1 Tax=Dyadobacter luticola TaxID=1979387 RepID=A0A5R9KTF6_9BACT|nr:response regulator transcription factor [Dyadobacter luticola]TLU99388.1 response regulator transcription factor [Dyadobacter luticola]